MNSSDKLQGLQPIQGKRGATILGPTNPARDAENPDLIASPQTDHGTVDNLRWSFSDSTRSRHAVRTCPTRCSRSPHQ